jgi:hypothetical protein
MSETTLDRVPISQAQAESGLSRSTFYARLKLCGIVPLKVGAHSFLTAEHLERLADLDRHVEAGHKPETFPGAAGALASTIPPQLVAFAQHLQQHPQEEAEQESPEDLVAAEVEHLDRLLSFLTKAARLSWCLPTSKVELLLGVKPRGARVRRYGFTFEALGRYGPEISWRITRD